jgi:hypothetical protein
VRRTTEKEIDAVVRLEGPQRFEHFVKRVVDEQRVWGLWEDGWATMADDDGELVFPVWPAAEYAFLCAREEWAHYVAKEIALEEFLNVVIPDLAEQGALAGVFPTPAGQSVTPPLADLEAALREELSTYT